jgi:riboflavin kinase/FMN adenylyltransferase
MVEGPDFRFGKHRAGDAATLRSLADELGFELDLVLTPIEVSLDDQSIVRASSTIARWLLANGRVRDAARVLGRPYRLSGEVVPGDRRGRTIGFPTANLRPQSLLPADGVYACIARLNTGVPGEGSDIQICPAAVNIGSRPTFDGVERRVEAHLILDGHGSTTWAPVPGQPEYGWSLTLDFVGWVRDQVKFDGIDALRGQLRRDVDRVRMIAGAFGKTPVVPTTIRPAQIPGAR